MDHLSDIKNDFLSRILTNLTKESKTGGKGEVEWKERDENEQQHILCWLQGSPIVRIDQQSILSLSVQLPQVQYVDTCLYI